MSENPRQHEQPPKEYLGSLDVIKREHLEQRLEFWAKERDRLKEEGQRKRALFYHGKLLGGLEILDIATNNPEYVGWLRRRFEV